MKKALLFVFVTTLFYTNRISAQFSIAADSTNPSCNQSNGSITVTPSGGSNYIYKWSTGATTANVSNLSASTYTVTVYSASTGGSKYDTTYIETFDGNTSGWTLNTQYGTNQDDHNVWVIDDHTGGGAVGSCATNASSGNGDKKLYITNTTRQADYPGAQYDAGSSALLEQYCGVFPGVNCTATKVSATSSNISTIGRHNLILTYDCIGQGSGADVGSSYYSIDGGANYTVLESSVKSLMCSTEGKWTRKSFYLPSNAVNISTLKFKFNWENDNDGDGMDPPIGINNIIIRDSVSTGGGSGSGIDSIVRSFYLAPVGSAGAATINTPAKTQICASDSVQLCVSPSFAHYKWNNQKDTTQCRYVRQAGNYYVTATDANGCTIESNRISISVFPSPSVSIIVKGDTLTSYGATNYQWYRNGQPIQGATGAAYIATQGGEYAVEITDNNGCKTKSTAITLMAVSELGRDVNFTIYPNPAAGGNLQLAITSECIGCNIEIFDITGKQVYESKIKGPKQEIDISTFAKGMYVVKVAGGIRKFVRE